MNLKSITVRNFRRLKNTNIDLDSQTSIFVGSNNSGKTSATHILHFFLDNSGSKPKFSIHDFNSDCWKEIDEIGANTDPLAEIKFPSISVDLWFSVEATDLHRIIDLLPNLEWKDNPVGVRIEYSAKNSTSLLDNFKEANLKAAKNRKDGFEPWPKSLTDYLTKTLNSEYDVFYYVLDRDQFDEKLNSLPGYTPLQLGNNTDRPGSKIIKSLIRIDLLNAQRYLADTNSTGRSEDLSKRMNRFYQRNLEQKDDDFEAMRALANSEEALTKHLSDVFDSTLKNLNQLGYPGFSDPKLEIKAAFDRENVIGQTRLHYTLGDGSDLMSLPDKYNGLGFKNLIYMVIEILDFNARWEDEKENRPPLHLIIIEEPEAHLHAQLQQVFIKKIWEISQGSSPDIFKSQMIVTTHSPHIIYESGFKPIRYFQRSAESGSQTTEVLNLSTFYESAEKTRDFLQQYMKLTHCDLFFADAAILVEGNVERLLLPLMIKKSSEELNSSYLSIIEVGGAFAYIFKELIDFLGLTTLIITDLDSVNSKKETADNLLCLTSEITIGDEDVEEEDDDIDELIISDSPVPGKACEVDTEAAVTANQTLIKWMPKLKDITSILDAPSETKIQKKTKECKALVCIVHQTRQLITWEGETAELAGRTFEESFALENLNWTQDLEQKSLKLRVVTKTDRRNLLDISKRLFTRVSGNNFNKTDFALGLMMKDTNEWNVPNYIDQGLKWLKEQLVPSNETVKSEDVSK